MASKDPYHHPPGQIFVSKAEKQPRPSAPTPPPVRSLHPSLPLDSDPNPRIAAFVKSQQQHSSFYKQEGLALFAGWLEDQRSKEEEVASASSKKTPGGKGKEREREKPRAPGNEGIRAVDVLGGLGGGGASSSSAGLTGKGGASSGGSRVRMADRMRGKDGSSKKAATTTPASKKRRNDDDEGEESGGKPEGSEVVLTRRESEGRALGKEKKKLNVDPSSSSSKRLPPTSNHRPSKQPTTSKPLLAEASNSEDRPRDRNGKKRPRLDPVEEAAHDDDDFPPSPAQPPSSPPPKSKAKSSKPAKNDPLPPPPPKASSSKAPKSKSKPAHEPSSFKPKGKENLEAEENAVRLEERKSRRRAKAAIVNPKPTPAAASSSASSSAESDSTTDADSRRKTRRVRKRKSSRRHQEEGEEEESESEEEEADARKRRKKEKGGGKDKKKKRENRDLGASIGMGLGIMDTFKAGNLGGGPSRRLTLKREVPKPGVFNKGRSSSKVVPKGKRSHEAVGVQDLVFSESRFLSRPRPPLNSVSSASVDPEPQSRPHRSSRSRHKSPPPAPPPTKKKRTSKVVEDSDEIEADSDNDRPIETVSKFFSASKTKPKSSKEKTRKEPERKRADYSPSWPDVAEEDGESKRGSEQGRSRNPAAPSVHSMTRQGNARSLSLSYRQPPSHDAASTSESHHSQPQARRPSSRRPASSHQSAPNAASSSKQRTSATLPTSHQPSPSQNPEVDSVDVLLRACETGQLPSPTRGGSQRQERLVYDGTSSVGYVEIDAGGNGSNGGPEERGGQAGGNDRDVYSRSRSFQQPSSYLNGLSYDQHLHQQDQVPYDAVEDGLSELGAEADVFRSPGPDFKSQPSSRRLRLPSRFDVEDLPFDQHPHPNGQGQPSNEEDQQMEEDFDGVGFDPPLFVNDGQYSSPPQASSSRNRAPFHPLNTSFDDHPHSNAPHHQQQDQYFVVDNEEDDQFPQQQQQTRHTLLSDIPDGDEEQEEEEGRGMFGGEVEVDLRGHWRRHRT
ncbi:hypothetical protein BDY24DRAFT_413721 [Mrakia frigida]|uniref:uncharacterized protein n=1 Tax=Mrakia frigida TaxID=29902 RepID=UPI003FCBF2FC